MIFRPKNIPELKKIEKWILYIDKYVKKMDISGIHY